MLFTLSQSMHAGSSRYAAGRIVPVADIFKKRDDLAQKHSKTLYWAATVHLNTYFALNVDTRG